MTRGRARLHEARPATTGRTIGGRYLLVSALGRGAMGAVYEARDAATGRHVALKVRHEHVSADASSAERFEREGRVIRALRSAHVVEVLDVGRDPATGCQYIAMERLVGEDARSLLRRTGPLEATLALRVVAQACAGLAVAHGAQVVHRDIKPANLFLSTAPDGRITVKILDFGVAKTLDTAELTRAGDLVGSPMYMAPEQASPRKDVDHRADLWSLGVVLYELLSGRSPFTGGTVIRVLAAIANAPPTDIREHVRDVSDDVRAILARALQKRREDRFETAGEMLEALRRAAGGDDALDAEVLGMQEGEIAVEAIVVARPRRRRRRAAALTAVGVAAISVAFGAGLALRHRIARASSEPPPASASASTTPEPKKVE